LSRSELDPHALAVFRPLEDDMIPLDFVVPTQEEQCIAQPEMLEKTEMLERRVSSPNHNPDLATRNLCVLTVFFGICIAIACISIGTRIIMVRRWPVPAFLMNTLMSMGNEMYPFSAPPPGFTIHYINGHRVFSMSKALMLLTSLLLNIGLTSIFDAMSLISLTTLRWTLFYEGRLYFNSNSRLLTSSRSFGPCHWTMNIVSTIVLVVGYGATAVLTTDIYVVGMLDDMGHLNDDLMTGPQYALDFNAWGLVGLGWALLLQAGLCIWCLIAGRKIVKSWSSNPLGTTRAYVCVEIESPTGTASNPPSALQSSFAASDVEWQSSTSSNRTLHSRSASEAHTFGRPRERQPTAGSCVPQTRSFANFVWIILGMVSIWVLVVGIIAHRNRTATREYVLSTVHRTNILAFWQTYGQVSIPYFGGDAYIKRRDWLGLLIQSFAFSLIFLALHCVELLTEVIRDESTWRRATTVGADPDTGSTVQRMRSWPSWVLFAFKCITPWVFSYAFTANLYAYMNLLPLCALTLVLLLLALFSEYLIRHKFKGPQPAAYGNIRKLAAFVDEWEHEKLFWGDKGKFSEGVRKCGTAGRRLAEVDMGVLYHGLRA
jgi:hypothetical protein